MSTTPPPRPAKRERAAEDTLTDRTVFIATPKGYAEFLARLDAPPQPNERLLRTMRTPAPWDRT